MNLADTIKISLRSMRANKIRTGLTVLGLVVGIATVIVVFSAGEGIRALIIGQVQSFGSDFVQTEVRVPSGKQSQTAREQQSGQAIAMGVQVTTMKLEDMEAVNKLPNVRTSYAGMQAQEQVSYGSELKRIFLFGASATYVDIDQTKVASGRFYTEEEDRALAQVAVLGPKVKERLFGDTDPIGKYIRLRKAKYQVIGVMEPRGAAGFINFDEWMIIPVQTVQKKIMGVDYIFFMIHQLEDVSRAEETAEEIRRLMRERHEITDPIKDDFRVTTMAEIMETLSTITGAITLLLLAIVGISLLVGGVGVMNIMYVAVSERTAEIGLRKAVGARYADIMRQFLFEAVLITVLGGAVGAMIGTIMSYLLAWLAGNVFNLSWQFIIPAKAFVIAFGFSVFFGLVFGVYPARKAARLDPIQALIAE